MRCESVSSSTAQLKLTGSLIVVFFLSFCLCPTIICSVNDDSRSMRSSSKHSPSKLPHADLVKWQGTPLRAPLLRLPMDLTPLALECFDCILRYSGDQPLDDLSEVKCVYTSECCIFCAERWLEHLLLYLLRYEHQIWFLHCFIRVINGFIRISTDFLNF